MKKYLSTLILSLSLVLLFVLWGYSASKAAGSITIDSSLNYGTSYNYKFSSSKLYDKYAIEYIMYSKDSNQYFYEKNEYTSSTSLRNTIVNATVKLEELPLSSNSYNLSEDVLQININFIKSSSCGFQNLETNCKVDSLSHSVTVSYPTPVNISPTNGYSTSNSSITLEATSEHSSISGYFYKFENNSYTRLSNSTLTLDKTGTYSWYAINNFGKTSEAFTITKVVADTKKPTLVSPSNNANITTANITLQATDNVAIDAYYYKSDKETNYAKSVDGQITVEDGLTYTWYAVDTSNNQSSSWNFTVALADTTNPVNSSPLNGAQLTVLPIKLTATDNKGVTAYYYKNNNQSEYTKSTDGSISSLTPNVEYSWYAEDASGNRSETWTFTYYVPDTTKPTLTSPSNNATISNLPVTLTATDNVKVSAYYYKNTNDSSYTLSTTGVIDSLVDGTYVWYAVDEAGNKSNEWTFTFLSADTTDPTLTSPANNSTIKTLPLTLSATDNRGIKGYYYKTSSASSYTYTTTGVINDLTDGDTYTWYAVDTSDNQSSSWSFKVQLDDVTPPVGSSPKNNATIYTNSVTLVATDNKGISGYYYKKSTNSVYSYSKDGNITGLSENTTYNWYAVDTSDNKSAVYSFTYAVPDTTKPTIVSPKNNATVTTKSVTLVATDNVAISTYYYKADGDVNWTITLTGEIEKLTDSVNYSWYATDTSGNKSDTVTFYVSIVDSEMPEIVSPDYGATLNTVNVQLVASDDKGIKYYVYSDVRYQQWKITTDGTFVGEHGVSYYWYAVDHVGNETSYYMVTVLLNDTTKPTNKTPANNATVTNSYVQLKATDNLKVAKYYISKNGGSYTELLSDYATNLANNTTYSWYAVDANGNESSTFKFKTSYSNGNITNIYPSNNVRINEYAFYLTASSSKGITKYYYKLNNGSTVWAETEDGFIERLNYDMEYWWYAVDSAGNESEVYSFVYDYKESYNEGHITILKPSQDGYTNQTFITVQATATAGIAYIRYKVNNPVAYSTCIIDANNSCNIRNLTNNDVVRINAVDNNYSYSEYITIRVDLEEPETGKVTATGTDNINVSIAVGSDNFEAIYMYRLNGGEWIEYTSTKSLQFAGRGTYLLETRAVDGAGNEAIDSYKYTIGDPLTAPKITVNSGIIGTWTNKDVRLTVTPQNNHTNYYCLEDTCTKITTETTVTLSTDFNGAFYTKTTDDNKTYFTSTPVYIKIDKTAPIIGTVFAPTERYNINGEYSYISIDAETIIEASNSYEIYYKFRDVNDEWKPLTNGRVPLYSYYIAKSGTYYVDIMIQDAAGNESDIRSVELLVDVEGPQINIYEKPVLDIQYDDNGYATKWTIKFEDIVDDYGYVYHVHFQMWDQYAFENGLESVVNISEYTPEDTDSFYYDATHLENTKWYFLLYVCDSYINCSYSNLYYYSKTDTGPGFTGGDSTTISNKSFGDYTQDVLIGIAAVFVLTRKKKLI